MVMDNMRINIVYLYYDILNVYGDRGNVLILKKVAEQNNIRCTVKYVSIGDTFNFRDTDIIFIGGGQDNDQMAACKDLIVNKKNSLQKYIEDGGAGLYICGAYQLLGKEYIAADGEKIEGTGILDINTEKGEKRFMGDIIIQSSAFNSQLVGFENHSGRTYIDKYDPLGMVTYGNGNNGTDKTEGLIYKNTICTYMHGCCLSKNPEITRFLIESAINKKYKINYKLDMDDSVFTKAKNAIISRYK